VKYRNKKTVRIVNGEQVVFDSLKEARRYDDLYLKLKAGQVSKLVIQPEFPLMEKQTHNGVTYRSVKYVADFKYIKNNKTYVEDVKSDHTRKLSTYRVKIKWWLSIYGKDITFVEIN